MGRYERRVRVPRHYQARRPGGCLAPLFALAAALFCCVLSLIVPLLLPPISLLVLGVDARSEGGESVEYARTDTILLVGIGRAQVSMLSIPRDLFIEMPGYGQQRANTIHRTAGLENPGSGPRALKDSIALSFGIRAPARFVRLDFEGFTALVDAVGGVQIDVPRALVDNQYPDGQGGTRTVRFEAGLQWMDGETALIYARTRQADDDYARAGRQQQVLRAVAGRLVNPFYWPGVAVALLRYIDTDMSPLDLWRVATPLLLHTGSAETLVIDRSYIRPVAGGAAPDYDRLRPWLRGRFD